MENEKLNCCLLDNIADSEYHAIILEHMLQVEDISSKEISLCLEKICNILNHSYNSEVLDLFYLNDILEILWVIASRDLIEKEPGLCVLKSLLQLVMHEKISINLLRQALLTVNKLLRSRSILMDFRRDITKSKAMIYYLGSKLPSFGDYEAQAVILECIFRCIDLSYRTEWAKEWFYNESLYSAFLSFNLSQFEVDCRKFLMMLNESQGEERRVHSFLANSIIIGKVKVKKPHGSELWVDFNLDSKCLSFFCAEISSEQTEEDSPWETIIINCENVSECNLIVDLQNHCQNILIKLNHTCLQLLCTASSPHIQPLAGLNDNYVSLFFQETLIIHPYLSQIFTESYMGQTTNSPHPQPNEPENSLLPIKMNADIENVKLDSHVTKKASVIKSPLIINQITKFQKESNLHSENTEIKENKMKSSVTKEILQISIKEKETSSKVDELNKFNADKLNSNLKNRCQQKCEILEENVSKNSKETRKISSHTPKMNNENKKMKVPIIVKISSVEQNSVCDFEQKQDKILSNNNQQKDKKYIPKLTSETDTSSDVSWLTKKTHFFETPTKTYFKKRKLRRKYVVATTSSSERENPVKKWNKKRMNKVKQKNRNLETSSPYSISKMLNETIIEKKKNKRKRSSIKIKSRKDSDWSEIDDTELIIERKKKRSSNISHIGKDIKNIDVRDKNISRINEEKALSINNHTLSNSLTENLNKFVDISNSLISEGNINANDNISEINKTSNGCLSIEGNNQIDMLNSSKYNPKLLDSTNKILSRRKISIEEKKVISFLSENLEQDINENSKIINNKESWQNNVQKLKFDGIERLRETSEVDNFSLQINCCSPIQIDLERTLDYLEDSKEKVAERSPKNALNKTTSFLESPKQTVENKVIMTNTTNLHSFDVKEICNKEEKKSISLRLQQFLKSLHSPLISEDQPHKEELLPSETLNIIDNYKNDENSEIILKNEDSTILKNFCPDDKYIINLNSPLSDSSTVKINKQTNDDIYLTKIDSVVKDLPSNTDNLKSLRKKCYKEKEIYDISKTELKKDVYFGNNNQQSNILDYHPNSIYSPKNIIIPQKLIEKTEELSRKYINTVHKYSYLFSKELMSCIQSLKAQILDIEEDFSKTCLKSALSVKHCRLQRLSFQEKLEQFEQAILAFQETEILLEAKLIKIQKKAAKKFIQKMDQAKNECITEIGQNILHKLNRHMMSFSVML